MRLPRLIAHLIADLGGYFWLPCLRCGRHFAGFEVTGEYTLQCTSRGGYVTCCPPSSDPSTEQAAKTRAMSRWREQHPMDVGEILN